MKQCASWSLKALEVTDIEDDYMANLQAIWFHSNVNEDVFSIINN